MNPPLNSRVRFQLDESLVLEDPLHEQFAVQVTLASIPYSFYDIDESNNQLFVREDIQQAYTVLTIDPGNYAATKLADTVEELMNVAFGHPVSGPGKNYEVVYIRSSNKMVLRSLLNLPFEMDMSVPTACRRPMGFGRNVYGPALELRSDQMVYMQGSHQYLHLMSDMVAFHGYSGNFRYRTNLLQSMRVASPPFSIITFENRDLMMHNTVSTTAISSFEILIQDVDGNPVNFRSMHWSVELAVMEVVKSQSIGEERSRLNRDARYSTYLHSIRMPLRTDGAIRSEEDDADDGEIWPESDRASGDETPAVAREGGETIYDDRSSRPETSSPSATGFDAGSIAEASAQGNELDPLQFFDQRVQGGDVEALRFSDRDPMT